MDDSFSVSQTDGGGGFSEWCWDKQAEISSRCSPRGTFCGRRARAGSLIQLSLKGSQAEWWDGSLLFCEGQIASASFSAKGEVWVVWFFSWAEREERDLICPFATSRDGFMLALLNQRITSPTSRISITGRLLSLPHHFSWHVCDSKLKSVESSHLKRECLKISPARPSEPTGCKPKGIDWSAAVTVMLELRGGTRFAISFR